MTRMIEMGIMGLNDRNLLWNKLSFCAEVREQKGEKIFLTARRLHRNLSTFTMHKNDEGYFFVTRAGAF